ncbi:MAG TPA: cupin domain-containing protein [Vicinamibacterales bacterium]|nr:cupin domain-containing protein [Vicinamibacterales bacterium]
MIPDELEALVVAASVGALDPDERVDLQARLAVLTPDERSEVARLYDAATAMAASVPPLEPPAHVRERLLAETRKPSRYTVWAADAAWIDTGLPGIRARVLAVDKVRSLVTLLIRAEPGAVYPAHKHHGPEECFVISGSVVIDGCVLRAGDFHHADEDSDHGEITTTEGAEVLVVGAVEDYLPGAAALNHESG